MHPSRHGQTVEAVGDLRNGGVGVAGDAFGGGGDGGDVLPGAEIGAGLETDGLAGGGGELQQHGALGEPLDVRNVHVFDEGDVTAAVGVGGGAGHENAAVRRHGDADGDVAAVGRAVVALGPQFMAVVVVLDC